MPEPACGVGADRRRIAEQPPQHVDVVNRVLDERPTTRMRDIASPRRSVKALNRVVLVVSHRGREHSPEFSGRDARREAAKHRRPAQHQTDLVRDAFERARGSFGRGEIGRERLLAEDRQAPSRRGLDRLEVRRRPRAHPDRVDGIEQRGERRRRLAAVAVARPSPPGRRRRRRSASRRRRPASRRRAVAAQPRAPCRCGHSRPGRSGSFATPRVGLDQGCRSDRATPKRSRTTSTARSTAARRSVRS